VEVKSYHFLVQNSGYLRNLDRFAGYRNAKCPQFNSFSYCIGTVGVHEVNYLWDGYAKNWFFHLYVGHSQYFTSLKGKGIRPTTDTTIKNTARDNFLDGLCEKR